MTGSSNGGCSSVDTRTRDTGVAGATPNIVTAPDAADAAADHIVTKMLGESKEYLTVVEGLATLKRQLEQAQKDMVALQELKKEALAAPETFVEQLTQGRPMAAETQHKQQEPTASNGAAAGPSLHCRGSLTLPELQSVVLLSNINLRPWLDRLPRRATTKYDQNLEFLLARLGEMQARRPAPEADKSVLSSLLPLSPAGGDGAGGCFVAPTESVSLVTERVRRKFREIVGFWRSASAPALLLTDPAPALQAAIDRNSLFSPQPLKAQSIQFSLPFAPASAAIASSIDASPVKRTRSSLGGVPTPSTASVDVGSTPSSPLATNTVSPSSSSTSSTPVDRKKRRKAAVLEESPHHNLPWTEEERRRLDELMAIYPEEQISTRRYAKIAAALGTRTAAQVANRINKLLHKRRKHGGHDSSYPTADVERIADAQLRATEEWQQYEMLKKQIAMLEADPDMTVHAGFRCDRCGMDPILGVRWRCLRCVEPDAVDLCSACYEQRMTFVAGTHRPDHRFLCHKE